ncbi:DUF3703 domain-containing protein [Nocardia noduli]|uniref:DUF3703 domain-containing protein n=1 Tax=Nocardia noduli TaxID=2815722 RepID=UPI001C222F6E|nr:DUF3703 domain-containing protein [Nocardia noduli]
MSRLPDPARAAYHREMAAAKTALAAADRWTHLERAHILSRPDPWLTPATTPPCATAQQIPVGEKRSRGVGR